MRGLKKLVTGVLAGAMAFAMMFTAGASAQASEVPASGTITVSNTTEGKEYQLYKVFDATFAGSNVAYTYSPKADNDPFLAALENKETSPFVVTNNGSTYNVTVADGASEEKVLEFIKANGPVFNEETKKWEGGNYGTPVKSENGTGKELTFTGLDFGYYFITSSLGATVTINNAAPTANVIDKNQKSTLDKQEAVATDSDGNLQWKYVGMGTVEETVPTQAVGAVVNYKLTGTVTQYIGEEKVTFLKFTDTMSKGLTANNDVKVFVNGKEVTASVTISGGIDTTTTPATANETVTVIKLDTVDAEGKFLYAANATYEITYSATVNEYALDEVQNNKVELTDNNGNDLGTDTTKVVNYNITLTKTDESGNKLADAWFKLYTSATGDTEVPVVLVSGTGDEKSEVDNVYRVAKAGETGVEMATGKTGVIVVKGLKNGAYYFEETKAPAGYNKLTARTDAVTVNGGNGAYTVINHTGSLLPSTGGIGTTIFYIIGGILIVAAVAYFMVRRKANAQ